jgi:hypothetical protein
MTDKVSCAFAYSESELRYIEAAVDKYKTNPYDAYSAAEAEEREE